MGREPSSGTYHASEDHPGLKTVPGVVVARIDGPLFFADADRFRTLVMDMAAEEGHLVGVVVDADAVHLTDTDGADILSQVAGELQRDGAALVLAGVHKATLELWRRAGLLDAIGSDRVYATIDDAVRALDGRRTAPRNQHESEDESSRRSHDGPKYEVAGDSAGLTSDASPPDDTS